MAGDVSFPFYGITILALLFTYGLRRPSKGGVYAAKTIMARLFDIPQSPFADFVIGSLVGAVNASYFVSAPNPGGIDKLEKIWRALRRNKVFRFTLRSALRLLGRPDKLERHLPFRNLEEATISVHVIATNLGGTAVCLCPAVDATMASAAIPGAFPPVRIGEDHLMDGAVGSNTPILTAAKLGATRIIALPSGFTCAIQTPPSGMIARALHAITLLIANQMVRDLKELAGAVDVFTLPNLCPLNISPYDFTYAADNTRRWIKEGGLTHARIPAA